MKYLSTILSIVLALSCQKPVTTINSIKCDGLKEAIASKNVAMAQQELADLLNQDYSEQNLQKMATAISSNCDMTAKLECFDCIKTNPPQSELSVSFVVGDPVRQFVLDLASATDNTIKVISVE